MSLFGGKKTYVASTCYNMAGDEKDRPDYLKTMVVGSIIGSRTSIGDALNDGYLSGPGIKLRGYYRWAQSHYNGTIGLSASGLAGAPDIDPSTVAGAIGGSVSIQMIRSGPADYEVWAEQWVLLNHPAQIGAAWTADFSDATGQITVTLPDSSSHSFTPTDFNKASLYIYAAYNETTEGFEGPIDAGPVISLAPGESFPPTSGWETESYVSIPHGSPVPWNETHGVYFKFGPVTSEDGRIFKIKTIMNQDQTGPETRTHQTSTQEIEVKSWSDLKVYIYRIGSGNSALDAQVSTTTSVGGFFAPIPVRLDNKFISSSYLPDQYAAATKAYDRLTGGGKFDELIEKLQDNESLPDIDFAFVVPGVSLNVKDNSCRKYLYEFFRGAMLTSVYGEAAYSSWVGGIGEASDAMAIWAAWYEAQGTGGPLDGTPEPGRPTYSTAARNEIRVRSTNTTLGYDTRIAWKAIAEDVGAGLAKPDAKVGEVWLTKGSAFSGAGPITTKLGMLFSLDSQSQDLFIHWQVTPTSWRRLTIRGLVHQNYVYQGKYVEIKSHEALDDEEESGFIVPIHYETWRGMSLKDTTQMSTACVFLVLNSYKVVKKKWYQTGIFKILMFVAVVVISVLYPPLGISMGSGLLGASAAVGIALGFTGLMAAIVGAIANALASMILMKIISMAAVAIFGEKIGAIIAMVASFAAVQIGTGLQAGMTITQAVAQLSNPLSLLALTNALGQGIAGSIQVDVQETLNRTQDILDKYKEQSKEIAKLYEENIGYGRGLIDPMMLVSSERWYVESGETFLARTLMTGTDLAELSNTLVSDFSDLTLSTELPL